MVKQQTLAIYWLKKRIEYDLKTIKQLSGKTQYVLSMLDLPCDFALDLYRNNQLYEILDVILITDSQIDEIKKLQKYYNNRSYDDVLIQEIKEDMIKR